MKMKRIIPVILALLINLIIAVPVLAYLDSPSGSMSISSVRFFRNTAEEGDAVCVFEYHIPYTVYPDTPATSSVVFRVYSPDGSVLLATASPYNFVLFETNGYGHGVGSFYFAASDNFTWGQPYKIDIQQLPIYYSPADSISYYTTALDYSSAVLQDDSQADVSVYIIGIIDELAISYPSIELKTATDTATVLSVYGESYFSSAIPGLRLICPTLFMIQSYVPERMSTTSYDMSLSDDYSHRQDNSDIKRGADRIGAYLHVSGYFILGIGTLGISLIPPVYTQRKGWGLESGLAIGAAIIICASILIGNALFAIVMIASLLTVMALINAVVLKRA